MNRDWALALIFAAFALMLAWAIKAEATETYVGLQYSRLTYSADNLQDDLCPGAGIAKVGVAMNGHLGAEIRYGVGLSEDARTYRYWDYTDLQISAKLDNMAGLYLRGSIPINQKIKLYGLAGYTRGTGTMKIKTANGAGSFTEESDGASFGAGATWSLGNNFGLSLEYMSYFAKSNFSLSALGLGVIHRF